VYAEERQQAIADEVRRIGRASVADLAGRFSVTSETVRRDLATLERAGHLQRVHGGAVRPGLIRVVAEQGLDVRETTHVDRKLAIGTAAMKFLPPNGGSVLFDAGTTTFHAAMALPHGHGLTLITNSIPIAGVLTNHSDGFVHAVGGRVRGLTQATVGADTVAAIARLRVSTAFIGTNAITTRHGLSTPYPEEAAVKRAMVSSADQVVVLADSSKMGREDLVRFASLDEVDVLITDSTVSPTDAAELADHGIEVVLA